MGIVSFRVDASSRIGYGHVVRCSALAEVLTARGADVRFICRELQGHYCDELEDLGFRVHRLPDQDAGLDDDIVQTRSALEATDLSDWLVVNHYGLDATWEKAMRASAGRILVIDDLVNRTHTCDLLLDQNFMIEPTDCNVFRTTPDTRILLGPKYALLRSEFKRRRSQRSTHDGSVRRVLLCFGGADPQQHTMATLNALRPHASHLERIDIVAGLANLHREAIAAACAALPNVTLHCPAQDISQLLAESDLAIGAGGSMIWERACLCVPTLAFGIAENQRHVMASLINAGYLVGCAEMYSPDEALIAAWLTCLLNNPNLLRGLSARSATLVDGRGAERVANAMFPAALAFRPATPSDSDNLLNWRNDPAIRSVSLNAQEIDRKTHEAWLQSTFSDSQRILLIAEYQGKPAGVIRFDLHSREAVISVYCLPKTDAPGGLIRQATNWLRTHHPEIAKISAEVLPDNKASLAAFKTAGYRDASNTLIIELDTP